MTEDIMDGTTLATVLVIIVFALVMIAAFVVFQPRSKVKTKRDLPQILGKGEKS